jgi:hypothetical protein
MRRYLEVGVAQGWTLEQVRLPFREGVDPNPMFDVDRLPAQLQMSVLTSDAYFAGLAPDVRFDAVFIDGLHHFEQTYRDLCNALRHCDDGIVLVDDVVPSDEWSALRDPFECFARRKERGVESDAWHGDVFRMVPCLRDNHPELSFVTIVTGGNPQLLVWRRQRGTPVRHMGGDTLNDYLSLRYHDVFADGVPPYFAPVGEEVGLAIAAAGVRWLRSSES